MATNYPTGLDTLSNPSATTRLDNTTTPHATQHANVNDAIEAIQTKIGIDGSTNTNSLDHRIGTLETNLGNALGDFVPVGDVGQPDGVASLDANGKVPLSQLGNLIDGAPAALDTLNELAAAINDDASYAATITTALSNKAPSTNIPNSALANSSITINGSAVSLGGSATINGLPSQLNQNGKFLKTDGSIATWADVSASGPVVLGLMGAY